MKLQNNEQILEKLKNLHKKIGTRKEYNQEFRDLISLELYELIQENETLKGEHNRRSNYFHLLAKDEGYQKIEENLFQKASEIASLVDEDSVKHLKNEYISFFKSEKGFINLGNPKLGNAITVNKDVFTTSDLLKKIPKRESYYVLGDTDNPLWDKNNEEIAYTPSLCVRLQYQELSKFFIGLYFDLQNLIDKEKLVLFSKKRSEYEKTFSEFLKLIYKKPSQKHIKKHQSFDFLCRDFYGNNVKPITSREINTFEDMKDISLIVTEDMMDFLKKGGVGQYIWGFEYEDLLIDLNKGIAKNINKDKDVPLKGRNYYFIEILLKSEDFFANYEVIWKYLEKTKSTTQMVKFNKTDFQNLLSKFKDFLKAKIKIKESTFKKVFRQGGNGFYLTGKIKTFYKFL